MPILLYVRHLSHAKKYEYDYIYLFETEPEKLGACEGAVIKALEPLFNRSQNPKVDRMRRVLKIDYNARQDSGMIRQYLEKYARYEKMGLFGFALPVAAFTALEKMAAEAGSTTGELLQEILEKEFSGVILKELEQEPVLETNLITSIQYGKQNDRSAEQAKQFFHQKGRVPGAMRIGRDWVLPKDTKFPKDLRGIRRKSREAVSQER